ncbi:pentatricopeptide repeat-containing protein [Tanacetum coccineum]
MLKEQLFYQPKAETYMKLIILFGRSGQPQHARNLFNMMVEEGLEPTASRRAGGAIGLGGPSMPRQFAILEYCSKASKDPTNESKSYEKKKKGTWAWARSSFVKYNDIVERYGENVGDLFGLKTCIHLEIRCSLPTLRVIFLIVLKAEVASEEDLFFAHKVYEYIPLRTSCTGVFNYC